MGTRSGTSAARIVRRGAAAIVTVAACGVLAPSAGAEEPPPGANDFGCEPSAAHPRPVVLVHGLGATMSGNWSYNSPRLAAAGYCVFALTYGQDERNAGFPYNPGGVIRMQRSSRELKRFVNRVLRRTGARSVDLIGHSEGTVMPRWYLEKRGGAKKVKRFIALTPLWRGTTLAGLNSVRDIGALLGLDQPAIDAFSEYCASCPQFLRGSKYLTKLNRDGEAIPGVVHTNIVTRYDELVIPYDSGIMRDGGTNIVLQDVCPLNLSEHGLVAFDSAVTQLFFNALDPKNAQPIQC